MTTNAMNIIKTAASLEAKGDATEADRLVQAVKAHFTELMGDDDNEWGTSTQDLLTWAQALGEGMLNDLAGGMDIYV